MYALAAINISAHWRLRNKFLPIEMRFDPSGNAIFTLRLPLHKRIGTQFKCFVTVRHADAIETVKQFLHGCDRINNHSVSKSVKSSRIYFLLDQVRPSNHGRWACQQHGGVSRVRLRQRLGWTVGSPSGRSMSALPSGAGRSDLIAATVLPIRSRSMVFDMAALIACAADVCTAGPTCMYGPSHRLAASLDVSLKVDVMARGSTT
jgi:hypothetical protein